MKVIIEADGGSRGNPGVAGSGTLILDETGGVLRKISYAVGTATNNVAEYHGLLNGLKAASELGATAVDVRMDSKLVVEQMSGRWKIKHPDMKELALQCQALLRKFDDSTFTWIPRNENSRADALANIAMDAVEAGAKPGEIPLDEATCAASGTDSPTTEAKRAEITPTCWNGATTTATRLILLRHGQTQMSANRQYSGHSDPKLTEVGQWQAARAAQRLAARGGIAAIVSSPLQRCTETAQATADALGLPVTCDAGLIEVDFGEWDGLTFNQAYETDPKHHASWLSDPQVAPPGGESLAQAHQRVAQTLNQLRETYAGKTVLVVSHVSPIKAIVSIALGGAADMANRMHLDLGSISIAEFYSDGPTCVRLLNDTAHLAQSK